MTHVDPQFVYFLVTHGVFKERSTFFSAERFFNLKKKKIIMIITIVRK